MSNTLEITGNLVRDPELRETKTGKDVCNLRIADGREEDSTLYLDVTVWNEFAVNVANSFKKGDRVIATGFLKGDTWTDKEDNEHYRIIFNATSIGACTRYAQVNIKPNPKEEEEDIDIDDDDIPF